jgi:two-component system chemotaxis response regulator CheB
MKKVKVLIVDDSALVRQTLVEIFKSDPEIEVVGTAADPYLAVNKIKETKPDVITLDVEMPKMDGLTFLKKLMAQHPIPVVIISTLTERGTDTAIHALECGAVDVIAKPKVNTKDLLEKSGIDLCDKVKAASFAFVKRRIITEKDEIKTKLTADVIISKTSHSMIETTDIIIAVGASTGGTQALKEFLISMPIDCPGIVIVQHMPEMFTTQFAKRLNECCLISVKEAHNGDPVLRGHAIIAHGSKHLLLKRSGAKYYIEVKEGPLVNRHKPSVDVLFRSVARYAGKNSIGVIMTGMGNDGAKGLLEMKEAGAYTIAQDEKSCVVFGMPKEAIKLNAAKIVLPLSQISSHIINQNLKSK